MVSRVKASTCEGLKGELTSEVLDDWEEGMSSIEAQEEGRRRRRRKEEGGRKRRRRKKERGGGGDSE